MQRLYSEEITELSNNLDILEVFRYYRVELISESSQRWKINCTLGCFDKTPSLKVFEDTNSWYAFCCAQGGDPFQFIRLMEPNYPRAIEVLVTLSGYQGSVDRLLTTLQRLHEKPQGEQEQKRIAALNYMLGIAHREFLARHREQKGYSQLQQWVEQQYRRFDEVFTRGDLTFEQAEKFYQRQLELLKQK